MDIKDSYLHGTIGVVKSISVNEDKLTYTLADINQTTTTVTLPTATQTANGLLSSTDKIKLDTSTGINQSIPYIVGPTTDTTAGTWTGTYAGITDYTEGLTIIYVPNVAGGSSTTTLNINGIGSKVCYSTGVSKVTTHYPAGTPILFTYSGGYWKRADYYYDSLQLRVYRQTTDYNADYPILVSRTLASSIGTSGSNNSSSNVYSLIGDDSTKTPTINPLTGEIKAPKFTGTFNGTASSVTNSLIFKINSGSTEGTNLYTYNGAANKTLDIKQGDNVTLTATEGTLTIAASDSKVTQSNYTNVGKLRILLSYYPNDETNTASVRKSSKLTFNPYSGELTSPKFKGDWTYTSDSRSVATIPSDYKSSFKFVGIKNPSVIGLISTETGSWVSLFGWRGYTDNTGPHTWELASDSKERIWVRSGVGISSNGSGNEDWKDWHKLAYTSDIPTKVSQLTNDSGYITEQNLTNYITLNTEQTITGAKTFTGILSVKSPTYKKVTQFYSIDENSNCRTIIQGSNFSHSLMLYDSFTSSGLNYATLSGGYINDAKLILRSYDCDTVNNTATVKTATVISTGDSSFSGQVTAKKFITGGGTSSQFVKGDGTLDSNTYVTLNGTGATGTWDININGTAGNADTVDGYHAQNLLPVRAYNYTNGYLVKTDIPADSNSMITFKIEGNGYQNNINIFTQGCFYNYNVSNSILASSCTNYGLNLETINVFNYNNVVCLWFEQTGSYQSFLITVVVSNSVLNTSNHVVSVSDSSMPADGVTRLIEITPNIGLRSDNYTDYINTTNFPGLNATVTSVGLSVPTGFSVSSSPITTSGTLGITFASGYSLPTTAKQNNWDTVYNWYTGITATDTDALVNKWGEIVDFLDSVAEGTDITDEFVTRKTDQTITGAKTFESNSSTTGVSLILKNKGWWSDMSTAIDFYNGIQYTVPNARIETKMEKNGTSGGTLIFYTQTKHADTNPNPNGLTERLRIDDKGLTSVTGDFSISHDLTISNDLTVSHYLKVLGQNITSNISSMFCIAPGYSSIYLEAGNNNFTDNVPLYITGYNGSVGNSLYLKYSNIYTRDGNYINIDSGNYTSYTPILNSSSEHATNTSVIYAPTTAGTSGQYLMSNGSGAPVWTSLPSLASPYAIKFKNSAGTVVSYNGSQAVDLTDGVYDSIYAKYIKRTAVTNGTNVREAKANLLEASKALGEHGGLLISHDQLVTNWNTDDFVWTQGGIGSFFKIGGGYANSSYSTWLVSSIAPWAHIGVVRQYNSEWRTMQYLAWTSDIPTTLKNPYSIKFTNTTGTAITYDGSASVDLSSGINYATKSSIANNGIFYIEGTGTTAGTWLGEHDEIKELYKGLTIAYKIPIAGVSPTTLKINNLQAVTCYYNANVYLTTHYPVGSVILLVYDGTYFRVSDYDNVHVADCSTVTASSTAAKGASATYYKLRTGNLFICTVCYDNTAAAALTLNVNKTGAKPIWINGIASSATNYTLPAGRYLVYYDGTNYYFYTNGGVKIPQVYGNAETSTNVKIQTLVADSDLNTLTSDGVYGTIATSVCRSLINAPTDRINGEARLEISTCGNSNNVFQTLYAKNYLNQYDIWIRSGTTASFSAWSKILTSSNYNSYSPKLDGTGATGTWGISITGSAATLTTSRTIWGQSFDGSSNIDGDLTIMAGATDKSIKFLSGGSGSTHNWRIAYIGTGTGDTNYLSFESTKATTNTWEPALQLACLTLNATFAGTVTAPNFVQNSNGISDFTNGTVQIKTLNALTNETATTYAKGAAGQILRSNGTNVYWSDLSKLTSTAIKTNQSYSLKNSSWTDTGYSISGLETGSYMIQVTSTNMVASGIFSVQKSLTDTMGDEIPLHVYGSAGWRPYLRTNGTKLEISANHASAVSRTVTIKIVQII